MSGFGGAFAAAMIGIIFVIAISSMTSISVSQLTLYQTKEDWKDRLSVSIDGGMPNPGGPGFLVNMTLLSGSSVGLKDFIKCDVFIVYFSGGLLMTERLDFGTGWRIVRATIGGLPEIINPIRCESGSWDPGETLEIAVTPSSNADEGAPWHFRFAAYDGSIASMSFGG